jgi:hypothetical protein
VTIANNALRRTQNLQPPAPRIVPIGATEYEVFSQRTGNRYLATVLSDGNVACDCPSRKPCYHIPAVRAFHARRLEALDPLNSLSRKLNSISRLAQSEHADFYLLDEIGRLAHDALRLLAELQSAERQVAA